MQTEMKCKEETGWLWVVKRRLVEMDFRNFFCHRGTPRSQWHALLEYVGVRKENLPLARKWLPLRRQLRLLRWKQVVGRRKTWQGRKRDSIKTNLKVGGDIYVCQAKVCFSGARWVGKPDSVASCGRKCTIHLRRRQLPHDDSQTYTSWRKRRWSIFHGRIFATLRKLSLSVVFSISLIW